MQIEQLSKDVALRAEIVADEGRCTEPYEDSLGIWTGGVGHNIEAHDEMGELPGWLRTGIPDATIDAWFDQDIGAAITCCHQVFDGFGELPDEAQRVLVNMAFTLMYGLRKWHGLRCAVRLRQWTDAGTQILHSRFAGQAPERCRRLAKRMSAMGR